ncbi:NADH dehydrogenase [ubiquinone] 1 subunit C1, mitochondrial isoform X2 [Pogona vitticeps]|uniref:NADH dehydrogenase [ubiquinone] 1 subunit C1, mitochondrial isoform X2 n=1 Tax=Pogona vitticeps TaxID=103695 RepID=A0ABM5GJA0_9SAUR
MAVPLQLVRRRLLLSRPLNPTLSRSAFIVSQDDPSRPKWIRVGLSIVSTIAIWGLIFKDRSDHFAEYERRKAKGESQ